VICMNKPLIGVLPLADVKTGYAWMKPNYVSAIAEAGAMPLILPLTEDEALLDEFTQACDGFLLTGGYDISPSLYGQEKLSACGDGTEGLDRMEAALLPRILAADKPLLGICRGLQFLNVSLGGTLWQDIPSQRPSHVEHRMDAPYDRFVHRALQSEDSPLLQIIPEREFSVNSAHHQGICRLGEGLFPAARSEDGLVEAVCMPEKKFVYAVQWHPEDLFRTDPNAAALFQALVCAAMDKKKSFR